MRYTSTNWGKKIPILLYFYLFCLSLLLLMFIEKFNWTKVLETQMLTGAYLEDSIEARLDHTYSLQTSQHLKQETKGRSESFIAENCLFYNLGSINLTVFGKKRWSLPSKPFWHNSMFWLKLPFTIRTDSPKEQFLRTSEQEFVHRPPVLGFRSAPKIRTKGTDLISGREIPFNFLPSSFPDHSPSEHISGLFGNFISEDSGLKNIQKTKHTYL